MQALVNLGNVKFERAAAEADDATREDLLLEARTLYDTAARHEPDCLEAIYNIGLAAKAAEQYDVALEQFILLNGMVPNQVHPCRMHCNCLPCPRASSLFCSSVAFTV